MNQPSSPEPEDPPAKPQTLAQCHEVIDTLSQQLAQLREQVAWLQERVKLDSRNSSKPPSSDVAGTSRPRRSSERKRGGQPGHKGTYRTLLDESEVDAVHECPPPEVCECGGPIEPGRARRHQVTDLAQAVRAEVQEYRLYRGVCGHCRKTHESRLPAGVPRGQIGPRALALIGALGTRYHLTQDKIRTLLGEVLGVRFSLGAISQAQGLVAQALQAPVQQAAASCHGAAVLHMDETSWRQAGAGTRHWVWATVQPQVVVYQVLPSRARYVAQALAGERPAGVLVTDRYAVYDWVAPERRQVCWAHLLRDFERIAGRAGAAGCVGRRLLGLGRVLFRWRARDAGPADFARLQARVHQALERGTRSGCRRTAQRLRQPARAGGLAVDLRASPRRRAHQQRRRAGAAHGGAQAQDQRPDALDARPAVRRPGPLRDGELPPPGPRPARLDGAGAARLAGRRPDALAAAGRLSAPAGLASLHRVAVRASWWAGPAGRCGAGRVKEGGREYVLRMRKGHPREG